MIDIFGLNGYMRYFCTRFPRDGKPCNWHSDRNGVRTLTFFFPFALISTKNTAVEKKFEKKLPKHLEYMLKSSYLCTRFPKGMQSMIGLLIKKPVLLRTPFSSSFTSLSQRETTRKRKKKKTSEIIWSVCLKVLTFASAFWKEKQF